MNSQKGKFIVLYGINNLGKTTQARLLIEYLKQNGVQAEYLKYPIYDLEPTGPIINDYLRGKNKFGLSSRLVQSIYTQNRLHYQNDLLRKLNSGIWIIAEDYVGTGLAWGGKENLNFLTEINSCLETEDLGILFDGDRFIESIEDKHKHENDNTLMQEVRASFLSLSDNLNWSVVNSNRDIEDIHKHILHLLREEKMIV